MLGAWDQRRKPKFAAVFTNWGNSDVRSTCSGNLSLERNKLQCKHLWYPCRISDASPRINYLTNFYLGVKSLDVKHPSWQCVCFSPWSPANDAGEWGCGTLMARTCEEVGHWRWVSGAFSQAHWVSTLCTLLATAVKPATSHFCFPPSWTGVGPVTTPSLPRHELFYELWVKRNLPSSKVFLLSISQGPGSNQYRV